MRRAGAAHDAARRMESSAVFRGLARGGYAADGVVHVLIGILVLTLAFGGRAQADQSGALRAIAGAPLGLVALVLMAVLLGALALYHLIEGFVLRSGSATRTWGRRLSEWGQALVFATFAVVAVGVAGGARPDGDGVAEQASRDALALPGGPVLLGAAGLGIVVGAVVFVTMGVLRSFEKKMAIPSGALGVFVTGLGITGYVAEGAALGIVGVLLVIAAVTADAAQAGGLDDGFGELRGLLLGPELVGIVGAGFVAYGLFLLFRARYARL